MELKTFVELQKQNMTNYWFVDLEGGNDQNINSIMIQIRDKTTEWIAAGSDKEEIKDMIENIISRYEPRTSELKKKQTNFWRVLVLPFEKIILSERVILYIWRGK